MTTCSATDTTLEPDTFHDEISIARKAILFRATYFQHLDPVLNSGVEVDVVRSDTSSDTDFQVLGLMKYY